MSTKIFNIYDPELANSHDVKRKLSEINQVNSPLIGRIKYFSISDWDEHNIRGIESLR